MPVKIKWANKVEVKKDLYFSDLDTGDTFKIVNSTSKGVVYMRVEDQNTGYYGMLELATGKVFASTPSRVERVNVEIHVDAAKPSCY